MQRGAALSWVWMQQGMLTVAASLRAHRATAMAEAMVAIDAIADANAIRPTALARAEVELAEGRVPKPARSSNVSWGRSPRTIFAATSRTRWNCSRVR